MVRARFLILLVVASALLLVSFPTAEAYRRPPSPARQIRCESESHRHTYCRTYASGRVRLERRLSKAPCREYDTWGADDDGSGVWVRDGCRAVFTVLPWGAPSYAYPAGP